MRPDRIAARGHSTRHQVQLGNPCEQTGHTFHTRFAGTMMIPAAMSTPQDALHWEGHEPNFLTRSMIVLVPSSSILFSNHPPTPGTCEGPTTGEGDVGRSASALISRGWITASSIRILGLCWRRNARTSRQARTNAIVVLTATRDAFSGAQAMTAYIRSRQVRYQSAITRVTRVCCESTYLIASMIAFATTPTNKSRNRPRQKPLGLWS